MVNVCGVMSYQNEEMAYHLCIDCSALTTLRISNAVFGAQPMNRGCPVTVPKYVSRQFGLKEGGELRWKIKAEDNESVVLVTPIKV